MCVCNLLILCRMALAVVAGFPTSNSATTLSRLQWTAKGEVPPPYTLRTTFPSQTYADPGVTLREVGLIPNATIHLAV